MDLIKLDYTCSCSQKKFSSFQPSNDKSDVPFSVIYYDAWVLHLKNQCLDMNILLQGKAKKKHVVARLNAEAEYKAIWLMESVKLYGYGHF